MESIFIHTHVHWVHTTRHTVLPMVHVASLYTCSSQQEASVSAALVALWIGLGTGLHRATRCRCGQRGTCALTVLGLYVWALAIRLHLPFE